MAKIKYNRGIILAARAAKCCVDTFGINDTKTSSVEPKRYLKDLKSNGYRFVILSGNIPDEIKNIVDKQYNSLHKPDVLMLYGNSKRVTVPYLNKTKNVSVGTLLEFRSIVEKMIDRKIIIKEKTHALVMDYKRSGFLTAIKNHDGRIDRIRGSGTVLGNYWRMYNFPMYWRDSDMRYPKVIHWRNRFS